MPQEPLLGPLLFCVNDLPEGLHSDLNIFADDAEVMTFDGFPRD